MKSNPENSNFAFPSILDSSYVVHQADHEDNVNVRIIVGHLAKIARIHVAEFPHAISMVVDNLGYRHSELTFPVSSFLV